MRKNALWGGDIGYFPVWQTSISLPRRPVKSSYDHPLHTMSPPSKGELRMWSNDFTLARGVFLRKTSYSEALSHDKLDGGGKGDSIFPGMRMFFLNRLEQMRNGNEGKLSYLCRENNKNLFFYE